MAATTVSASGKTLMETLDNNLITIRAHEAVEPITRQPGSANKHK